MHSLSLALGLLPTAILQRFHINVKLKFNKKISPLTSQALAHQMMNNLCNNASSTAAYKEPPKPLRFSGSFAVILPIPFRTQYRLLPVW